MAETSGVTDYAMGYSHPDVEALCTKLDEIVISGADSTKNKATAEVENLITAMDSVFVGGIDGPNNPKAWFQNALRQDAILFGSMLDQFMTACKTEINNASSAFTGEDKNMAAWIGEVTPGGNSGGA